MNLAERFKIVPVVLSPTNFGATVDCQSINMKNFHRASFIFNFGACTGDVTFSCNSGATTGAKTTAMIFRYALGSAAIGSALCDVLGATGWTTTVAPTKALTCTTKMVVLEVEMSEVATQGHNWITVTLAATAGIVSGVALLIPRFASNVSVTAIA